MLIKEVSCKSALSKSALPGLDYALNPYRGCQHGCLYCYSPEVLREKREWGSFVDVRRNMPSVLAKELKRKDEGVVGISTVTDGYQPAEKKYELTRRCLEVLLEHDFPISIQTKSNLILRDLDLIRRFSRKDVGVTITTLNEEYARLFEPWGSSPKDRLSTISEIASHNIDTWIFLGPILPGITDQDLEVLAETIGATGVKKVIVDKLRLRGRIWSRIEDAIEFRGQELEEFRESAKSPKQFNKIEERIAELCRRHNIKWVSAFSSSEF